LTTSNTVYYKVSLELFTTFSVQYLNTDSVFWLDILKFKEKDLLSRTDSENTMTGQ